MGDSDDLPEVAAVDDLVNLLEEFSVTQDMGDLEQMTMLLGCLNQCDAVLQAVGYGFFEKDIVSCLQGFQGGLGVELILGGDDGDIGDLATSKGMFP